ncbi:MAG TPA: phage integrase N-terminal SAM-like domain-containing protein [Ktedonobacteraceae bacterium]|nr:phage integrase N-terminal SAM-like domain-containing protein [Ktedonobacteraceae bacterium]
MRPFRPANSFVELWITEHQQACLRKRDEATIDVYTRILRQFMERVAKRPGHGKQFEPAQLTNTMLESYLARLEVRGEGVSHRTRVKSVIKHFYQWLIEEKEVLKRNPTNAVTIKTPQQLVPRILSPDQRFVLRNHL